MFGFSLRTVEQVMTEINLLVRLTPPGDILVSDLLSFLVCLRVAAPDLYAANSETKFGVTRLEEELSLRYNAAAFLEGREGVFILAALTKWSRNKSELDESMKRWVSVMKDTNASAVDKSRAGNFLDAIDFWTRTARRGADLVDYTRKRIELAQAFESPGPTRSRKV
jgi:hypothetical protein